MSIYLYSTETDGTAALAQRAYTVKHIPYQRVTVQDLESIDKIQKLANVDRYPFLSADGYLASDPVAIVLHAAVKSNLLPATQDDRTRAVSVVESSVKVFELLKKADESDAVERELIISEQIPPCLARVEILMRAKGLPAADAFDISDVACDVLCWALTESKQQCFRREDVKALYPTISNIAEVTNSIFIHLSKNRCLGVCDSKSAAPVN